LFETSQLCKKGRSDLNNTKLGGISGGLDIIAKYRKREAMITYYDYLTQLNDLKRKEHKIDDQLQKGHFDQALKLLNNSQDVITNLSKISVVGQSNKFSLIGKFQDVKSRLEKEIKICCGEYNQERFSKCISGCLSFKDVEMDHVIESFYENYIHQVLRQTVIAFVPKFQMQQNESSLNLETICKGVPSSDLLNVVFNSLYSISIVLFNFYKMYTHPNADQEGFAKIKWFLTHYRKVLWENCMTKLIGLLVSIPINQDCKLKDYVSIYNVFSLFCELGEEFSESDSTMLRSAISAKCKEYFRFFNRRNLEELRMILENETFSKLDGQTYEEIHIPNLEKSKNSTSKIVRSSLVSNQNPFKKFCEDKKVEYEDENKKINGTVEPPSDDDKDIVKKSALIPHVFTLTSIKMTQKFNDFALGMAAIPVLAEDFAMGIRNLYLYYMFTIFSVFGNVFQNQEMDPNVKESLRSIYKSFIELLRGKPVENNLFFIFVKSNVLDFTKVNLVERVTAIESIASLTCVHLFLDSIEDHLPQNKVNWWIQSIAECDIVNKEVRRRVSSKTIPQIFNVSYLLTDIPNEKWELNKDSGVITQTSKFIQQIIKDYETYLNNIKALKDIASDKLMEKLITAPIVQIMDGLIEGYSRISKCNRSGRDLMKFNYSMMEDSLKKLTGLDQLPKSRILLDYINGYYYPEQAVWSWVEENYQNFSRNQVISLLKVMNLSNLKEIQAKVEKLEWKTVVESKSTAPSPMNGTNSPSAKLVSQKSVWDIKSWLK
jgi:hypothetical protein